MKDLKMKNYSIRTGTFNKSASEIIDIKINLKNKITALLGSINTDFEIKEGIKIWDDSPELFLVGSAQNIFNSDSSILKYFDEFSDIDLIVNVNIFNKLIDYIGNNPKFEFLSNPNKVYKEDNKFRFLSVLYYDSGFGHKVKIDFIFVEFTDIKSDEFEFAKFIYGHSASDSIYNLGGINHKILLRALTNKISEFNSLTIGEGTLKRILRNDHIEDLKGEITLNSKPKKDRYLKLSHKGLRTAYITLCDYANRCDAEELKEVLKDNPSLNFIRVKLSRHNPKYVRNTELIFKELINSDTSFSSYRSERFSSFVGIIRQINAFHEQELLNSVLKRYAELASEDRNISSEHIKSAFSYIKVNSLLDNNTIEEIAEILHLA